MSSVQVWYVYFLGVIRFFGRSLPNFLILKYMDIIIITGFGENEKKKIYKEFQKKLGRRCYIFSPAWKYRTIKDWVNDFELFILKKKLNNFTAIGFSVGAYIIACSNIKPDLTIYASISPLFREDIKSWSKQMTKILGKKRINTIGKYNSKPNSIFLIGEREDKSMFNTTHRLSKLNGSVVKIIKNADHDISQKIYFDSIIELVQNHRKLKNLHGISYIAK